MESNDLKWKREPRTRWYTMSTGSSRKLLVTSVASCHMIGEDEDPLASKSATGVTWVDECDDTWIHDLAVRVTAVRADRGACRCVVSLGKVVDETGSELSFGIKSNTLCVREEIICLLLHSPRLLCYIHDV